MGFFDDEDPEADNNSVSSSRWHVLLRMNQCNLIKMVFLFPILFHSLSKRKANGLVIFTGYTRQTGKTVTVLYDDGDEVTYGFVGTFAKLPYTSVKKGDTLALMDEEAIYIMVKRDGVNLDSSLLPAYLSGSVMNEISFTSNTCCRYFYFSS